MAAERFTAFLRRDVAYNRQPRTLVLLPFTLAATVLGAYAIVWDDLSITLMWVVVGLAAFVNAADGIMWFAGHVRDGYRIGAPKAK